jgi:hypothetical protein
MKLGRNVIHNADSHVQMANVSTLGKRRFQPIDLPVSDA